MLAKPPLCRRREQSPEGDATDLCLCCCPYFFAVVFGKKQRTCSLPLPAGFNHSSECKVMNQFHLAALMIFFCVFPAKIACQASSPSNPLQINNILVAYKFHSTSYNRNRNQERSPGKGRGFALLTNRKSLTPL